MTCRLLRNSYDSAMATAGAALVDLAQMIRGARFLDKADKNQIRVNLAQEPHRRLLLGHYQLAD